MEMKKLTTLLLTLAMLVSISTTALAVDTPNKSYPQSFYDVPKDHWAFGYIAELVDRGVLEGYEDGSFKPEGTVSRAEFAKIMVGAAGVQTNDNRVYFSDMQNHWAIPYVNAAKDYLMAYADNTYRPNQAAVREDVTMAMVKLKGYDVSNADFSYLADFADNNSISNNVKKYVAVAVEKELISGFEDNTFRGQVTLTRAEAATLLWRVFQYGNDNKVIDSTISQFDVSQPTTAITPTQNTQTQVTPKPTESVDKNNMTDDVQCSFSDFKVNLDTSWGDDELFWSFDYVCNVDTIRCGVEIWNKKTGTHIRYDDLLNPAYRDIIRKTEEPGQFSQAIGSISSDGKAHTLEVGETYEWVGYVYDRKGNIYKSQTQEFVFTCEDSRFLQPKETVTEKEPKVETEDNSETNTSVVILPQNVKFYDGYTFFPTFDSVTNATQAENIMGQLVAPVSYVQYDAEFTRYFYDATQDDVDDYEKFLLHYGWTKKGSGNGGGDSRGQAVTTTYLYYDEKDILKAQLQVIFFPDCENVDLVTVLKN